MFKTDLSVVRDIDERADEEEAVDKSNMSKKGAEKTCTVLILWFPFFFIKY